MRKFATFLLSLGAILSFTTVLAPSQTQAANEGCGNDTLFLNVFKSWDHGIKKNSGSRDGSCYVVIESNENGFPKFIWTVVLNIFYDISVAAGIIAVVMIIINGFQYMTSGGSADKVGNAKKGLMQSIIGLAITLLAATIINFIVGLF